MCKFGIIDSSFQVCCPAACGRCGDCSALSSIYSATGDRETSTEVGDMSSFGINREEEERQPTSVEENIKCCPTYLKKTARQCSSPFDTSCLLEKPNIDKCWSKAALYYKFNNKYQTDMRKSRHEKKKFEEGGNDHSIFQEQQQDEDENHFKYPLPIPESYILKEEHKSKLENSLFTFDILQVVTKVDCIVVSNANRIYTLYLRSKRGKEVGSGVRKHVIITPDSEACGRLGDQFKHTSAHLHCVRENDVFDNKIIFEHFHKRFNVIGPISHYRGSRWYWNQLLALYAVATSLNGLLGYRVRVLDERVLTLEKVQFFTTAGHEIFDYNQYPDHISQDHISRSYQHAPSMNSATTDSDSSNRGSNITFLTYGPLYYSFTGQRLIGSANAITNGISMTKQRTRKFLTFISPGNNDWNKLIWVDAVLNSLCDDVADRGFSLYWFYFTFAIMDEEFYKNNKLTTSSHSVASKFNKVTTHNLRRKLFFNKKVKPAGAPNLAWSKIVENHEFQPSLSKSSRHHRDGIEEVGSSINTVKKEEKLPFINIYPSILIRLPSPGKGLPVQKIVSPYSADMSSKLSNRDQCRWLQIVLQDIDYGSSDIVDIGAHMVVFQRLTIS